VSVRPKAREELSLRTADGVALSACRYPATELDDPPASGPLGVVIVHGFASRKDHPPIVQLATALAAGGREVLVYDGRGHGRSGGACTLGERERLDVDAAVTAALDVAPAVVVVGASMGGIAVLNHLADGSPARGGVIVSTPARWRIPPNGRGLLAVAVTQTAIGRAMAARHLRTRLAVRPARAAPPREQIAVVRQPMAVIHGTADRMVPVNAARELHAAARGPCTIDVVPGMGHGYGATAVDPVLAAVRWIADTAD
jgi:alpha-beta hydrolase superfamily lysophospholipase